MLDLGLTNYPLFQVSTTQPHSVCLMRGQGNFLNAPSKRLAWLTAGTTMNWLRASPSRRTSSPSMFASRTGSSASSAQRLANDLYWIFVRLIKRHAPASTCARALNPSCFNSQINSGSSNAALILIGVIGVMRGSIVVIISTGAQLVHQRQQSIVADLIHKLRHREHFLPANWAARTDNTRAALRD